MVTRDARVERAISTSFEGDLKRHVLEFYLLINAFYPLRAPVTCKLRKNVAL